MKKILFLGGHHNSAVPIIKFLKKEKKYSIIFVGHKYASTLNKSVSSEYKEIKALKVAYLNFSSPKFYNVGGLLKYFKLIQSFYTSVKIIFKEKPDLVFSFGGYLAVPFALAAWILRVKLVTHEQTADFGMANAFISKLANRVFLTWPNNKFTHNQKYTVTGIPLREEILSVKKKDTSVFKKIFVQGGKQGSHVLNNFVFDNIEQLTNKYEIYHQTSKHSESKDHLKAQELEIKYSKYHYFDYIHGAKYTNLLDNTDFVLSRAGAHFVYEMSYIKMPCIFIPITWSSKNEQLKNATVAKKFTPAVLLNEKYLSLSNFEKSVKNLAKEFSKKAEKQTLFAEKSLNLILNEINHLI